MKIGRDSNPESSSKVSRDRVPTNTLSHRHRVQRWANFIAGYSIEFVEECLSSRNSNEDIVIDPFLGCGTTLVTARNHGFQGVGYERHPVFYNLAKAKLGNLDLDDLNHVEERLLSSNKKRNYPADANKFLHKLFSEHDLERISKASNALDEVDELRKPLAVALFLKSCEEACGAQTDGIYKAPTSRKNNIPFHDAIVKTCSIFQEDVTSEWYREHWTEQKSVTLIPKSSTDMSEIESDSLGICITSPPYLNNFDYAEMTRMHLYLLGWAGSWREISESVRNDLITNTTTALKGKKDDSKQKGYRKTLPLELRDELDEIVRVLTIQRKTRAGKKEYDYLVYPYYSEISKVLSELYRSLKRGGEVHWVVADAALYGVHIKTQLHTAAIMRSIGFQNVTIDFIRRRGHRWVLSKRDGSKEGLGEYHIKATK